MDQLPTFLTINPRSSLATLDGPGKTLADLEEAQGRPIETFGAKVDTRMMQGVSASGTALTVGDGSATPADVGRTVVLYKNNGMGVAGQAVVTKYNSPTSLTLGTSIAAVPSTITKVQAGAYNDSGSEASEHAVTLSGVVAGHSLILVGVSMSSGQQFMSVTDNVGGKWVKIVSHQVPLNGVGTQEMWQCVSSPGGNVTVTAKFSASWPDSGTPLGGRASLSLTEWSGLGVFEKVNGTRGHGKESSVPGPLTTHLPGELVIAAVASGAVPSVTPTGFTVEPGGEWWGDHKTPLAWKIVSGAEAVGGIWGTVASVDWATIVGAFIPIGGISTQAAIGTDDTAALQAAINWASANKARIVYTGNGIAGVFGPQVTGKVAKEGEPAVKYPYSGQLLIPSEGMDSAAMGFMEIAGSVPPTGEDEGFAVPSWGHTAPSATGLVLLSSAPSGWVVSQIPDAGGMHFGNTIQFSFNQFNLRRVTIRTPLDMTGQGAGGLNLKASACADLDEWKADTQSIPWSTPTYCPRSSGPLTNAGAALVLPGDGNWTICRSHRFQITGYAKGISHGEHASLDGSVKNCGAGLAPGGYTDEPERGSGGHTSAYHKVGVWKCGVILEPTGTQAVLGDLEIEGASSHFIDDDNSYLTGLIRVGINDHNFDLSPNVRDCSPDLHIESIGRPSYYVASPVGLARVGDTLLTRQGGGWAVRAGRSEPPRLEVAW